MTSIWQRGDVLYSIDGIDVFKRPAQEVSGVTRILIIQAAGGKRQQRGNRTKDFHRFLRMVGRIL